MECLQKKCPGCRSTKLKEYKKYMTKNHGGRQWYRCEECGKVFSETKNTFLEGLTPSLSQVWQVLETSISSALYNKEFHSFCGSSGFG